MVHFVNADLIAGGLSPLRPELAARHAGRLVVQELSRLVGARKSFAFAKYSEWKNLPASVAELESDRVYDQNCISFTVIIQARATTHRYQS